MTKLLTTIIILIFFAQTNAQDYSRVELDSLFNNFTFIRGVNFSDLHQKQVDENPESIKCGMQLVNSIKQNLEYFSHEQQQVLIPLLQRPVTQTSIVSSNGFFRVHYDISGNNAIGYDLNLLLQAVDSVYNFEIIALGFPPPPSDDTSGGDGKYDIYVLNIVDYGYTQPENKISDSRWSSFMVIDNDYPAGSYFTQDINAARVTVAHEFHHAIQMGSYAPSEINSPYRTEDVYFYELTSTSFEEFVFDDVNDYYAYMPSYFNHPEYPMSNQNGYNLAIWNIYLQKNYGFSIIKRQWELMPAKRALESIALSINDIGSTFGNELNKFGIWTYFTHTRSVPGRYFEEAASYEHLITPTATVSFTPPSKTYDMTIAPVANYFLKINLPSPDGVFYTIITNSDYQKTPNQTFPFSFSIYQDTVNGVKIINDFYSITFNQDGQTFWNNSGILNDIVVYGDSNYSIPNLEDDSYAYPMPYKKSSSGIIRIAFQADLNLGDEVDLNIYSAGLESVYSGKKNVQYSYMKNFKKMSEVLLLNGDISYPSGVYIYVIKSGNDIYKGKLVIFND
jgi:hypothetical protein